MRPIGANRIQPVAGRRAPEAIASGAAPVPNAGYARDAFGGSAEYASLRLLSSHSSQALYAAPSAVRPAVPRPTPAPAPAPVPAGPHALAKPTKAPEIPKPGRSDIPDTPGARPLPSPAATAPAPAVVSAPAPVAPPSVPAPPPPMPSIPAPPAPVAPVVAMVVPPPVMPITPLAPPPPPAPPAYVPPPVASLVPLTTSYDPISEQAKLADTIAKAGNDSEAYQAAMRLIEQHHAQPGVKPGTKSDGPGNAQPGDADRLKGLKAEELARLGREDKKGFMAALRPAAEAAEKQYGVPAAITLAQAALETGWGQHIIPGFNLFGIKGHGPAGTVSKGTWEVYGGKKVTITANFAKYHDFFEAVFEHGKLFHNGYYDKAMNQFARDHDPFAFARNITGTYATDPSYGSKLSSIMRDYHLA